MMLFAILCFSLMDATAKALSTRVDTVQVLWARYLGQTLLVMAIVARRIGPTLRTQYLGLQFLRSCLLLAATTFFFFGIARIGLAEATAVMDLNPVLITLGAAVFLGERFGLRRAIGVGVALIGALIIIRPGTDVFSPYAILPFCAALCISGYAIATRFVGRSESVWTSMLFTGLVGSVILTIVVPFFWVQPDATAWGLMLLIGCIGTAGQMLMIGALMRAEASQVAPFSYAGLIFATVWGMLFFDEIPDGPTIFGALVIVVAGIYVWHRETRAAVE
ncbi:DMT family transporter [Actibacterium lipolyticum]|uniref:Riboflavin transporter n=1 Tax=Actibacterium lipolyticum TaxID=1524263 RepID=A0A238KHK8_9RHOB|nr:DMT family transporter [Actibacterium lipolyticum]SMX42220.1 Riboflavin transporter [Actibacterium lipolyticum]